MLAFEVSSKAPGAERLALALRFAHRVRILGSQALALAYCAAGRADALLANTSRSIDCAAGLLMVREAGGAVSDASGGALWDQPIGLEDRISLAVGSTTARHAALLGWLKQEVLAEKPG
jgi:myo-inositol-1(or 4)-monophosphatase